MVKRKTSSSRRRKISPKTYVFPYRGLDPVVQIKNGIPLVAGNSQPLPGQQQFPTDVATGDDVRQIQAMIQGMMNAEDHNQILQAIAQLSDRIDGQDIQVLQTDVQNRIEQLENTILDRMQNLENAIQRNPAPLQQPGEAGPNVRQTIIELQNTEQEILNAVNNLRPLLSQEIIRQTDRLSNQLDQHLIALDGLKRDIQKTVVDETTNARDRILNDIEILRRNSLDSARVRDLLSSNSQESNQELSGLVQQMIDRLGSSSRTDIQELRENLRQNQDIHQREQEILKTMVGELKDDIRAQIDGILRSLSTIPREQASENPLLVTSQERVLDLESQLRVARDTLASAERSLEDQKNTTRRLETQIGQNQSLINQLQGSSEQSNDLRGVVEEMKENETRIRSQLNQECMDKLQTLRSQLTAQSDERVRETTATLRSNLEGRISELESDLSTARITIQDLQRSLEERNSRIGSLEQSISEKQATIERLQTTLDNLQGEGQTSMMSHQQELQTLREQLSESNSERESLQRQLETSRTRMMELEREVDNRQAMIDGLQTNSQSVDGLLQTIDTLKKDEEEKLKNLEDTLARKRLDDLRNLEARLNAERENQMKDLRTLMEKRIRDLEAKDDISRQTLEREAEKVRELQNELQRAQESNSLLQAIGGEAEELKRNVDALREAEARRLEELERSLNERHAGEISALSSALKSEEAKSISEKKASKAVQDMLQEQISKLETNLALESERLRKLEGENSENKQKALELESLLQEQKSEFETLQKSFNGQKSALEKTVRDLESQLERERTAGVSGQEANNGRIRELESLLNKCREESERQKTLTETNLAKITEMERDLLTMRDKLNEASTSLDETLNELERLGNVESDNESLLRTVREQSSLLDRIKNKVVEILQRSNQSFTDKLEENVDSLSSYIDRIKDMKSSITEVIPRYVIIRELENKLELIDTFEDQRVEFDADIIPMKLRMFSYSNEIYELYEQIRRNIYDTELVHIVQGRMLTQLKKGIVQAPSSMEDLIPMIVNGDEGNKVGVKILTDVFSPIIPTNMTSNNNISIASSIMRALNYKDAISLTMEIIPDQGSRKALSRTLQTIVQSAGVEIPETSQRLYNMQEMYIVQMMLVDEIRSYLDESKYYTRNFIYGLEARLIILDSFIKAFLESNMATQQLKSIFKSKISSRSEPDRRIISYVKLRADDNMIDPRYSMLMNEDKKMLQISHQPFIVSSLSRNDSETPFFQHDMYGPFSRVFLPNETNREISQNVSELIDALNSNKDVCTLALGPSGSGKTSTLLYFRGSESSPIPSQGIIPLMLNQLDERFTMAQVTAFEFAANYESKSSNDYWRKYSVFQTPVVFNREEYEWVSEGPVNMENFSYDTSRTVCEVPSPFAQLTRTRSNLGVVSIGSFVAKLTDTRLNCGTPNNPVSSRTHLFLFIKLMTSRSDRSGPTLMVADLAGREKTFDCNSEAVLENFALNKYYPTLNTLLNDPLGSAKESPIIEIQVGESFSPMNTLIRLRDPNSLFAREDISKIPLKSLILELSLHTYFDLVEKAGKGSKTRGYVTEMVRRGATEEADVSTRFYSAVKRFFKRVIADGYMNQLTNRLENLEKQPLELRMLLEQLDDISVLNGIQKIIEYYAKDGTISTGTSYSSGEQTQRIRLERAMKKDVLERVLKLMPVFLNTILLSEYMNNVIKTAPVKVCGYRNIEGEFINRSLDELANLVLIASSFSEDDGPAVHPECLPISCGFAGLDCLLPKNVPKNMAQSAIAEVMAEGMGRSSFDVMNTVFCTFAIVNFSKSLSEGKLFRPIYDPSEGMIRETVLAFGKLKRDMKFYISNPTETTDNYIQILKQAYSLFSEAYSAEMQLQTEYKKRLEYRGMDITKMMNNDFIKSSYTSSINHWAKMRNAIDAVLRTLTNENLLTVGSQKLLEMDSIMRNFEELANVVQIKNQDTAIGVLMFVDDIVKRGLQPMMCSTTNEREDILSTTVGWSNVQLSI